MANAFEVTFEGDHILARTFGDKDADLAKRLWTEVAQLSREHECLRILGIGDTATPISTIDAFDFPAMFREVGIGPHHRIAWVELNQQYVNTMKFLDDVLLNRGLPGRVFPTVEDAKAWLLEDTPAP